MATSESKRREASLRIRWLDEGEHRGPLAHELFGFYGRQLGVVAPDVAYGASPTLSNGVLARVPKPYRCRVPMPPQPTNASLILSKSASLFYEGSSRAARASSMALQWRSPTDLAGV